MADSETRFASLPHGRKSWAVAAVHGDARRLRALHKILGGRIGVGDNLVYLGNFLGHGDEVVATVDELLLFRRRLLSRRGGEHQPITYLRGGQEEMLQKLLQIHIALNPREVIQWMLRNGIEKTLQSYGVSADDCLQAATGSSAMLGRWTNHLRAAIRAHDGHEALMSVLRRAAFTDDNRILFVNAGIDVSRPLSEQTDSFWWEGKDFTAIKEPYGDFVRIVRGYDRRHKGLDIGSMTASIDGGCGFGGLLIAVCFGPDGVVLDRIEI